MLLKSELNLRVRVRLTECDRFHVDKLSSAHVYIRMNKGETIDDCEPETLEDCAQLCKANSIQGVIDTYTIVKAQ